MERSVIKNPVKQLVKTAELRRQIEMKKYSQGCAGDGPCILEDGQPLTPDEIVKKLNDKTFTVKLLTEAMDTISSGFADSKFEIENYADQKLIDVEIHGTGVD